MIFLFIIMEWPYKMSLYLACRCRWTLQSGQDKWHHSGRAWTSIHWCQSHNVGRHIPGHIDTGKTPLCSHIFQNAHMGLHLLVEGKGLEYGLWNTFRRKIDTTTQHTQHITTGPGFGKKKNKPKKSRLANWAFIHVLVAGTPYKASRTGTNGTAIKRVGVTHCSLIARVAYTCIIKVA